MVENEVKRNSLKAWFLAARPKTLTAAATPVIIAGSAAALYNYKNGSAFDWTVFLMCLFFAFLMQIASNFVNDLYDFKKGTDTPDRLGPKRACAEGWISSRTMLVATIVTMVLASLVGLPLIFYGGWEMLLVGVACILFCVLYTTFFSYEGLGDILVILFFGVVPLSFTFYLLTASVTWQVVSASFGVGFVIDTLLIMNNFRDRDTDAACGKKTVVVRVGAVWGHRLYCLSGILGVLLSFPLALSAGHGIIFSSLMLLYVALHILTYRRMIKIFSGSELNTLLARTAINIFVFGIILSVALLVAML